VQGSGVTSGKVHHGKSIACVSLFINQCVDCGVMLYDIIVLVGDNDNIYPMHVLHSSALLFGALQNYLAFVGGMRHFICIICIYGLVSVGDLSKDKNSQVLFGNIHPHCVQGDNIYTWTVHTMCTCSDAPVESIHSDNCVYHVSN
jgi:hypothetical protein